MRLLTEEEAAEILRIKEHTLMKIRYRMEGSETPVPCLRIGGQIRYFEADLIEWARKQRKSQSDKKSKEDHQETLEETQIVRLG